MYLGIYIRTRVRTYEYVVCKPYAPTPLVHTCHAYLTKDISSTPSVTILILHPITVRRLQSMYVDIQTVVTAARQRTTKNRELIKVGHSSTNVPGTRAQHANQEVRTTKNIKPVKIQ